MLDKVIIEYEKYKGKKISPLQLEQYKAWAARAIRELENRLGWPFSPEGTVTVLGQTKYGCECDVDKSSLAPAPTPRGVYRFFSFNTKQPFAIVSPFAKIYAVYLCRVEPEGKKITSNKNEVVILQKINNFAPRYFNNRFGKYIQSCNDEVSACQERCNSDCTTCATLLVDAEWLDFNNVPDELLYMIFDYIDWMAGGGYANRGIKSESVDGHSVSYSSDWKETTPYVNPSDAQIIALYAGPYGSVDRKFIW